MTGKRDNEPDEDLDLYGPTESDIERFNREDDEYLSDRKQDAKSALWKLVAGGVFTLMAASMILNVLLPSIRQNTSIETEPVRTPAVVTRVFDGRTIGVEIDGLQQTVRYIGIAIPLYGDPFHQIGIDANRQWLLNQTVLLEADSQDTDAEGRLLRYVWLEGAMVNLNLLAVGLAQTDRSGTNARYREYFEEVEDTARTNGLGIWQDSDADEAALRNNQPRATSES